MAVDVLCSAEQTPEELVHILTGEKVDETATTKNTYTRGNSHTGTDSTHVHSSGTVSSISFGKVLFNR